VEVTNMRTIEIGFNAVQATAIARCRRDGLPLQRVVYTDRTGERVQTPTLPPIDARWFRFEAEFNRLGTDFEIVDAR
jgi:hypothetical protein